MVFWPEVIPVSFVKNTVQCAAESAMVFLKLDAKLRFPPMCQSNNLAS